MRRNKKKPNSTNFQIHVNCVAMETKLCIQIKEHNTRLKVGLCMHYYFSIIRLTFYFFYINCVSTNVGAVNYRASDVLKFDKF